MLAAATWAATWSNPAREREDALLHSQASVAVSSRALVAEGCTGERCSSTESLQLGSVRLELRPLDLASVWVEAGRGSQRLSGASHDGTGSNLAAGVNLSWPRTGWRPALSVQLGRTSTEILSSSGEVLSSALFEELQLAGFAVWGSSRDGVTVWVGPEVSGSGRAGVDNRATEVALELSPEWPAGLVAGAEIWSAQLGQPWRRGAHLTTGLEAHALQSWSLAVWVGLST